MDKKKLLLSFGAFLAALTAHCASFTVDTLSLTTLDDEARTVQLTNVKSKSTELHIPETVVYEGVTYTVTSVDLSFPAMDFTGNSATNVTTVTVPKTVEEIVNLKGGRRGIQKILFAEGSRLKTIGAEAFSKCKFEEISLPESVESIGERAFESCSSLAGISIPGNVTAIKARAFYGCSVLTDIKLPSKLEVIEERAFYSEKYCPNRSIVLPEGLLSIGKYAFDYAEIHPTGTVPPVLDPNAFGSGVTVVIDDMALLFTYFNADVWKKYVNMITNVDGLTYEISSDGAKLVKVPEGERIITVPETISYDTYQFAVISIEDNAFPTSAEEVYIKARVSSIGEQSFSYLDFNTYKSNLKYIELPASLKRIGYGTFQYCSLLKSIDIPDNVEYIGEKAFSESGIETFTAPAKLTEISRNMFSGCTKLTELNLPAALESISLGAISGTAVTELRIPHTIRNIKDPEYCYLADSLKNIFITGGSNDTYVDIDGVLFRKIKDTDNKELMCYPSNRDAAEYTVPDGTVGILEYAFYRGNVRTDSDPTPLKRVNLPENLESIGDFAFGCNNSLEHINLPYGLKSIGRHAFGLDRKVMIRVPETVTSIGSYAFGVNTIYIDAIQPPSCNGNPMDGTICVKPEAVEAYKSHETWSRCRVFSENDAHEADGLIYVPNGPSGAELVGYVRMPGDTLDIPQTVTMGGEQRNVTVLGENALTRTFPKTVNIPETVDSIGSSCFYSCGLLTSVNIGNARIKWPNFIYCPALQEITAGENNACHTTRDGVLYSKDMDTLQYYPLAAERETFFLPESVKAIGDDVMSMDRVINGYEMNMKLKNFYSLSQTLPVCGPSSFYTLDNCVKLSISNVTLYVPESLADTYRNADGWKYFWPVTGLSDEEISGILAGVEEIKADSRVRTTGDGAFYTLSGQRVTNPGKGIYIRNGKKVIVR